MAQNLADLQPAFRAALPRFSGDDVIGSPYAVAAYEPDPRAGTWADLAEARACLARRGMFLMLDFVPNHTALDHPWVGRHPEMFVPGSRDDWAAHPEGYVPIRTAEGTRYLARGRDPYFPPWADTVQINAFAPAARAMLVETVSRLAECCDALRIDMAMLGLNDVFARTWGERVTPVAEELWPRIREAVPELLLVAEAYWGVEGRLLALGFDYAYDKSLYDRLRGPSPRAVRDHLGTTLSTSGRGVHFVENHDEERAAAAFGPALRAAATIAGAAPGMRLFHLGQLTGRRVRLPVQLGRLGAEQTDAELQRFYRRLLSSLDTDVFHRGRWSPIAPSADADGLVAFSWVLGSERRLVVANLGEQDVDGWMEAPEAWDRERVSPNLLAAGEPMVAETRDGRLRVRLEAGQGGIVTF